LIDGEDRPRISRGLFFHEQWLSSLQHLALLRVQLFGGEILGSMQGREPDTNQREDDKNPMIHKWLLTYTREAGQQLRRGKVSAEVIFMGTSVSLCPFSR
jgi:hypothetical protein